MEEHKVSHKGNNKEEPKAQAEEKAVTLKESEYLKLKEEASWAKESREKALRVQADFENTRKRLEREKQDFLKFANEGIISELLNVLDDLERALELAQSGHQDLPAFIKGVEMILAHLYETLKEHGVRNPSSSSSANIFLMVAELKSKSGAISSEETGIASSIYLVTVLDSTCLLLDS